METHATQRMLDRKERSCVGSWSRCHATPRARAAPERSTWTAAFQLEKGAVWGAMRGKTHRSTPTKESRARSARSTRALRLRARQRRLSTRVVSQSTVAASRHRPRHRREHEPRPAAAVRVAWTRMRAVMSAAGGRRGAAPLRAAAARPRASARVPCSTLRTIRREQCCCWRARAAFGFA